MGYTTAEGEMNFCKVTDDDAAFLIWTIMFSNDVDLQVMQDQKYANCTASHGAWEFMERIIA